MTEEFMNVYDASGTFVGEVEPDGRIYDNRGRYRGRVEEIPEKRRAAVFNRDDRYVGSVRKGGQVPTKNNMASALISLWDGNILGRFDADGEISRRGSESGRNDEERSSKLIGRFIPPGDLYLCGAAAWLLIRDVLFEIDEIPPSAWEPFI